jgi:hypothetical protein
VSARRQRVRNRFSARRARRRCFAQKGPATASVRTPAPAASVRAPEPPIPETGERADPARAHTVSHVKQFTIIADHQALAIPIAPIRGLGCPETDRFRPKRRESDQNGKKRSESGHAPSRDQAFHFSINRLLQQAPNPKHGPTMARESTTRGTPPRPPLQGPSSGSPRPVSCMPQSGDSDHAQSLFGFCLVSARMIGYCLVISLAEVMAPAPGGPRHASIESALPTAQASLSTARPASWPRTTPNRASGRLPDR